jgi:hypothetical protein
MVWVQRNNESTREAQCDGERNLNPEIREDQNGSHWVTERSVVAWKRVMIVEQRDLSSRAMLEVTRG